MAENPPNEPELTPEEEEQNSPETEAVVSVEETVPEEEGKPDPGKKPIGFIIGEIWGLVKMLFGIFWELMRLVIRIEDTTDVEGTIKTVGSGIELKGYNIWILVASAILASIGLDTNSAAVIIGAMLISPLMSPILGLGLSVGINDRQMLYRSLYNFGIAVGVSLLTATLYFLITPLGKETPEMAARTTPTLLDVGVAFFGGVAGIVAGSRKDKTNAIPGVAIATALMPPMCVAGYGLATFNLQYFAGAFYLFFINSIFIALATFLIVRFLNFPLAEKVTSSLRKNFLRGTVFFVLVAMLPATLIFIDVIRDLQRNGAISEFLYDKFDSKLDYTVQTHSYIEEEDTTDILRVSVQGPFIPPDTEAVYQDLLLTKYGLKNVRLKLIQTAMDPNESVRIKQELRAEMEGKLQKYEEDRLEGVKLLEENKALKAEIERLRRDTLPMDNLRDEIRDWVTGIKTVQIGVLNDSRVDSKTIPDRHIFTVIVNWADSVSMAKRKEKAEKIRKRVRNSVPMDSIAVLDWASLQFKNQIFGPQQPAKEEKAEENN